MSPKITAIHSGGDWYDASADYVILPDGITIEDEREAWRHWYETIYLVQSNRGTCPGYKTLADFVLERGGRIPQNDELEIFGNE